MFPRISSELKGENLQPDKLPRFGHMPSVNLQKTPAEREKKKKNLDDSGDGKDGDDNNELEFDSNNGSDEEESKDRVDAMDAIGITEIEKKHRNLKYS